MPHIIQENFILIISFFVNKKLYLEIMSVASKHNSFKRICWRLFLEDQSWIIMQLIVENESETWNVWIENFIDLCSHDIHFNCWYWWQSFTSGNTIKKGYGYIISLNVTIKHVGIVFTNWLNTPHVTQREKQDNVRSWRTHDLEEYEKKKKQKYIWVKRTWERKKEKKREDDLFGLKNMI